MQVITLNVYVMCLSICMHVCMCVFLCTSSSVCLYVCVLVSVYVYAISCARGKTGRGVGVVENDPGSDTYETGGLIHKHSSKAPGPGNLRGKLLTSQPWRAALFTMHEVL